MASRPKPSRPLCWCQITDQNGTDLGKFAIRGDSMIVRSNQGWEKTVRAGPEAAWAGLARLVVSEPPP